MSRCERALDQQPNDLDSRARERVNSAEILRLPLDAAYALERTRLALDRRADSTKRVLRAMVGSIQGDVLVFSLIRSPHQWFLEVEVWGESQDGSGRWSRRGQRQIFEAAMARELGAALVAVRPFDRVRALRSA